MAKVITECAAASDISSSACGELNADLEGGANHWNIETRATERSQKVFGTPGLAFIEDDNADGTGVHGILCLLGE